MKKWLSKQLSLLDLIGADLWRKRPERRRKRVVRVKTTPRRRRTTSSHPALLQIWQELAAHYFPENKELLSYAVYWSNRPQIRTLASCNIDAKRVRVAQELNTQELTLWLPPLLYHEMCHAVLGDSIRQKGAKTRWHGPEFRALEKRHPDISRLDSWISSGGWATAVRSHRSRTAHARRKATEQNASAAS